ncbi:MAG TPA: hypothetical protein VJ326_02775 [Thermoplasmata archaeon]|nr:hypothetical protein [Thermoplasmata archaeon]
MSGDAGRRDSFGEEAGNRGSLMDPRRELLLAQFVVLPQVEAAGVLLLPNGRHRLE